MNSNPIKHIDVIDALAEQISALLDLLQGCDESTDIRTVHTAAEMAATMFDELNDECQKWRSEDVDESDEIDDAILHDFSQAIVDKMCEGCNATTEEECNNCKLIKAIDEVFKEREKND